MSWIASAYAFARLCNTLRTNSPIEVGGCTPRSAKSASIRVGMSPGASSRGSFASNVGTWAGAAAPCARRCFRSVCSPTFAQARADSESSQNPITFLRNRTRPSTPPSFVKPACRASSVVTGPGSSVPTSDQVPQEMYTVSSPLEGTPTTAEAVSCEPTVVNSIRRAIPNSERAASVTGPSATPASTSSGSRS